MRWEIPESKVQDKSIKIPCCSERMRNIHFKDASVSETVLDQPLHCACQAFFSTFYDFCPCCWGREEGTWVRSKSTSSVSICLSLYNWFCLFSNSTSCWALVWQCLSSWHNLDRKQKRWLWWVCCQSTVVHVHSKGFLLHWRQASMQVT